MASADVGRITRSWGQKAPAEVCFAFAAKENGDGSKRFGARRALAAPLFPPFSNPWDPRDPGRPTCETS